jgi:malate synthase
MRTFFTEEAHKLEARLGHEAYRAGSYEKARRIIEDIALKDDFTEFMTTVGYEHLG